MNAISRRAAVLVVLLTAGCPDLSYQLSWRDADVDARSDAGCGPGVAADNYADCVESDTNGDAGGDIGTNGDKDGSTGADADVEGHAPAGWELISAGTFTMGSPQGELGRDDVRERQHDVTLTNDFIIQATEVTESQYVAVMGDNTSWIVSCNDCPLERSTWNQAAAYCNALSASEGLALCYECGDGLDEAVRCTPSAAYPTPYDCPGYRLPTEAEWEYAARAEERPGETLATYNGDLDVEDCSQSEVLNPIAWYCGSAESQPHPVGRLFANPWGLYDMLGNVNEWCHDWFKEDLGSDAVEDPFGPETGEQRSIRGGSWRSPPAEIRAAYRGAGDTQFLWPSSSYGFRPVRTIPAGEQL
jgi:formylglycine-generating enzyme required for sulfatase activity